MEVEMEDLQAEKSTLKAQSSFMCLGNKYKRSSNLKTL